MTSYRCYFMIEGRHSADVEVVQCRDDDAARMVAASFLLAREELSVEVWEGSRCIAYLDRRTARIIA
jgi:hypothetical protein